MRSCTIFIKDTESFEGSLLIRYDSDYQYRRVAGRHLYTDDKLVRDWLKQQSEIEIQKRKVQIQQLTHEIDNIKTMFANVNIEKPKQ